MSRPRATPVTQTCPMPSPIRESRRCTRKVPTAGAARPVHRGGDQRPDHERREQEVHQVAPPVAAAPAPAGRSTGRGAVGRWWWCVVRVPVGSSVGGPSYTTRPSRSTTARWIRSANGPSSWSTTTIVAPGRRRGRPACRRWPAGWRGRRRRWARRARAAPAGRPACARSAPAAAGRRTGSRPGAAARSARPTASSASVDGDPVRAARRHERPASRQPPGGDHLGARSTGTPWAIGRALRHVAEPLPLAEAGQRRAEQPDLRRWLSGCRPTIALTSVDLPEPLAPSSATTSPRLHGEVDVAHDRAAAERDAGALGRRPLSAVAHEQPPAFCRACEVRAHQAQVVGSSGPWTSAPRSGRAPRCVMPRSPARVSASCGLASVSLNTVVIPSVRIRSASSARCLADGSASGERPAIGVHVEAVAPAEVPERVVADHERAGPAVRQARRAARASSAVRSRLRAARFAAGSRPRGPGRP